jgi:hypothetical protein
MLVNKSSFARVSTMAAVTRATALSACFCTTKFWAASAAARQTYTLQEVNEQSRRRGVVTTWGKGGAAGLHAPHAFAADTAKAAHDALSPANSMHTQR